MKRKTLDPILSWAQLALVGASAVCLGLKLYDFGAKYEGALYRNQVPESYLLLLYRLLFGGVVASIACLVITRPRKMYERSVRLAIVMAVLVIVTVLSRKLGVIVTYDEFVNHRLLR